MNHDRSHLLIAEAVDGPLHANDERELAVHLAGCADCRALHHGLRREAHQMASLPAVEVRPYVRAAVLARTRHDRRTRTGLVLAVALLLVAVLAAIVAGTGALPPRDPLGTPPPRLLPLIGKGSGQLYHQELNRVVGSFEILVREERRQFSGQVDVRFDDGEVWSGPIRSGAYWFDPGGVWHVVQVEACRGTPCEPFVFQLVDGRGRADRQDEARIAYAAAATFGGTFDSSFFVQDGEIVVPEPDERPLE